ncbi:SDH family Clp fold serine proteinase [Terriglobus tenax]|uniref:SDH family Clp fold serine proteinase n=1 Tax=Terriglobus tenax TaxID=1111115 RepID=UPI0021E01161|nr:ATP-dependent Clp protease proteolytic subunit [Terriglobus tenax]
MSTPQLDESILRVIDERALALEEQLNANVLFYVGRIHPAYLKPFRTFLEDIAANKTKKKDSVAILLETGGGSVQTVEKMVELIRAHYTGTVTFIVPDMAMSAGTVLCMSGNRIMMDYSSSLGPIDPQVLVKKNGEEMYVPALGYLDKVAELIGKSADNTLTAAEFALLKDLDLGLLRSYEQARDLSVELLKKWLIEYKFKDWIVHETTPELLGQPVTDEQRHARADEIARMLGDNRLWHSHGRFIGINTLRDILRLRIDDYTHDDKLRPAIRTYTDLLTDYMSRQGMKFVLHSPHVKLF